MFRLAIETATPVGSVAVGRGGQVLAEVGLGELTGHADAVVPALDDALSLAGIGRGDIGAVVVGAGPGSFTGVRVAGATAKGLVAALDVPLVAYSSLLALAAGVQWPGPVCALFDARRGEVYGGCWRVSPDGIDVVLEPMVGPVEEVATAVLANVGVAATGAGDAPEARPVVLFVGDGAYRYRGGLDGLATGVAVVGPGSPAGAVSVHPAAGTLLWLATHHAAMGHVPDVAGWEPMYVRGSSAERGIPG